MKRYVIVFAVIIALIPVQMYAKQKWYYGNLVSIDGKIAKNGDLSGNCTIKVFDEDPLSHNRHSIITADMLVGDFTGSTAVNAVLDLGCTCMDESFSEGRLTFKGTVEFKINDDKIFYVMKAGGIIGNTLHLSKDITVSRSISKVKTWSSKWNLECSDIVYFDSKDLYESGMDYIKSVRIPDFTLARYSFPAGFKLKEESINEFTWELIPIGSNFVDAVNVQTSRRVKINYNRNGLAIIDTGIGFNGNNIQGKMKPGDYRDKDVDINLNKSGDEWKGEIKYDDGITYKGTIYFVKGKDKSSNRLYSKIISPSLDEEDPLYFAKLTVADNIVFLNGTRYGPSGDIEETYQNGYSNLELEAAREKAARQKQAEQENAARYRAEKEKNTKATQAFLNSAWGKKFTFNGFGDQYGNYTHGSSVLQFGHNRTDIWLDVDGRTYGFQISGISDDTGKDIRVRERGTMVPSVYITPMIRNGKRSFKIRFVLLDLVYYLY